MALTYAQVSAVTRDLFIPKMVDNIFNSNGLLYRFHKRGTRLDGGMKIRQPILYAKTTAGGSYSGSDPLNVTDNEQFTDAYYDWKQQYVNITISRLDELKNSGKSQVMNFVQMKVKAAEKTMKDNMGTDLFGDGTGNSSKAIDGLAIAIDSAGTYGGIARGSYAWWEAVEDSTTAIVSLPNIRTMLGNLTIDNDKPTLIITTQANYNRTYNLFTPQQRFVDGGMAKAGFTTILVEDIPLLVDSHCTANYMYCLNENYLDFVTHQDENFRFEPFIKPVNQNASSAKVYWAGNLTSSGCRLQGKFTALAG